MLRAYDAGSLISTIAPPVIVVNPSDGPGELLPEAEATRLLKPSG